MDIILRQTVAEFLGTFLYLSLALLASTDSRSLIIEALSNGLLIGAMVQVFGDISGGHFNPAITIGLLTHGDIKILKALLYIIAQIVGAIAGSGLSFAVTPSSTRGNLGATIPNSALTSVQAFAIEFLMAYVLVSLVIATRRGGAANIAPVAIGLGLTALICACGTYTMSGNPARSIGPAVIMNIWTHHWVCWAGPILGAVIAGLLHRLLFDHKVYVNN
jgi:MIP family channel proteins